MILAPLFLASLSMQSIDLAHHPVISSSAKVKPGVYAVANTDDEAKTSALTIKGDNIVVDFGGAVLQGTPQTVEPDQRKGTGVIVQGKNITIKNLKVRGYKIGLIARSCSGLKIIDSDFSYNWKQHLLSTLEREDGADWMSYHHNESDEWLRYGAGIYLSKCEGFEVRGCTITGGQCGLMLVGSNKGLAWNNNFSFLSGVGIGLYRSSENRVMHNKIDWCVRGFSYGVYNRGQDSSGILIFEQCNKNVFAYNSATHGGDGFFLWAGQTTMDTGKGGCNDNILYGNDFSYSPANGIEATFSRNSFVNNLMVECWHGIWGGYSYDSKVIGNHFAFNDEGIAWEHGQDNVVQNNYFYGDNVGIHIWSNPTQDPNWGYAKNRDTKSRDWTIRDNYFWNEFAVAFQVRRTVDVAFTGNRIDLSGSAIKQEAEVTGLDAKDNKTTVEGKPAELATSLGHKLTESADDYSNRLGRGSLFWRVIPQPTWAGLSRGEDFVQRYIDYANAVKPYAIEPLKGGVMPYLPAVRGTALGTGGKYDPSMETAMLCGWRYIVVDEWGPYDFKSPIVWPRASSDPNTMVFEILGPVGTVTPLKGAELIRSVRNHDENSTTRAFKIPATIVVEAPKSKSGDFELSFQFVGPQTTDYRGIVTPAGKPVQFGYRKFVLPIDWSVKFFKWTEAENPKDVHSAPKETALQEIFKGKPTKELKTTKLDFNGASFDPAVGNDHYATVAEGSFEVPSGDYTVEMTTDDGARMWLDGKPIITDAWKYQGPTPYSCKTHLGNGKHTLKVEHFQIDGYASLQVRIKPAKK